MDTSHNEQFDDKQLKQRRKNVDKNVFFFFAQLHIRQLQRNTIIMSLHNRYRGEAKKKIKTIKKSIFTYRRWSSPYIFVFVSNPKTLF